RPIVVFVTAYDQYALHAFEACAIDYLLKPFSDKRFQQALARAKNEVRNSRAQVIDRRLEELLARVAELRRDSPAAAASPAPEYAERIVVKAGGDLHFVKTSDVLWIEAQGDFVKVQTLEQPQLVRETLQDMEKKLDGSRFLRIHRSFLVNVQHIKRVAPALYGDHTVYMSDGSKLRLSRNYRSKLKAFIGRPPAA
ncbi:MAG: response regulator transcription factor, partial [Patescibacteria group bacterium]|nr:response regulator transcription factor [Patescibacteria group bacterium]